MNCCVLGAGAWGTAVALHLDRCGHAVTLVPRRIEKALKIASSRENSDYLPGFALPHTIQIGCEIGPVLMEAEVVFFACPSKALRGLCKEVKVHMGEAWQFKLAIVMCKGLELETLKSPAEVIAEELPGVACGVLSGPTFAGEVAAGKPTAMVLALPSEFSEAERYQKAFNNEALRIYLSSDVRGTELGSTLKNVFAVASGLSDGLELGDNARAALLTRSLSEMIRIGTLLGGEEATFLGLSGFGDLVATCSGEWSRNRTFGEEVGRGRKPEEIISSQPSVVEGYRAAKCFKQICEKHEIEAPILSIVYSVLYEELSPAEGMQALMRRELKAEAS